MLTQFSLGNKGGRTPFCAFLSWDEQGDRTPKISLSRQRAKWFFENFAMSEDQIAGNDPFLT